MWLSCRFNVCPKFGEVFCVRSARIPHPSCSVFRNMLDGIPKGWKIALLAAGAVLAGLVLIRSVSHDPSVEKKKKCLLKLFPQLSEKEAYKLAQSISTRHFAAGSTILYEYDTANSVYCVRSGEVELFKTTDRPEKYEFDQVIGKDGFLGLSDSPTEAYSARSRFFFEKIRQSSSSHFL